MAEYLVDLNATQAAIRAGYSRKTAAEIGYENLRKPEIASEVKKHLDNRTENLTLSAERLDKELARCAYFDPGRLFDPVTHRRLEVWELDEDTRRGLSKVKVEEVFAGRGDDRVQIGQVVEVRWQNKPEAIQSANKVLGRLKDQVEHSFASHADLVAAVAQRLEERKKDDGGKGK